MRSKVTIVLLFLNVVLFYYIYHFEKVTGLDNTGRNRVFGPEVATISSLVRSGPNSPTIRLTRDPAKGNSWWLTQPYEWAANPHAVERLLTELQLLEHKTSFAVSDLAKSGQSLADFGLEHPALTLTFDSAGKSYPLKVGDDTKISDRLYLLSPDGTRIHVVGRSIAEIIGLPIEDLRADAIFTVPVFEVRSLNVQTSAIKVRVRRDTDTRWAFETPILARASKNVVEVTVNALNALTAKNFLEAATADLERTGLTSPALRVTLEGNARREILLIGNAVPASPAAAPSADAAPAADDAAAYPEYFARMEDKAVIFTVPIPPPLLIVLRSAQESLRDPHVLDFEPATVTALTLLAGPGRPELTLQRLEGGTPAGTWQVVTRNSGQAPQTNAADTALVADLLQKLQVLSAKEIGPDVPKFVSDAPTASDLETYGFNQPERQITLNLSTGGGPKGTEASVITLEIGTKTGDRSAAYARASTGAYIYRIAPEILDQAPAHPLHYRQRLLRDLPDGAKIQSLTLTDLATKTPLCAKQLNETQTTWDQAVADEPEARRRAIDATLKQLHKLRAQRFTADTFSPDHADAAGGEQPWKYQLDVVIAYAGGLGVAQSSTSTLFLTERLGGATQLAGTAEFGGVVFEISQELLDALFTLTYREKHDPGLPPAPAEVQPAPAETPAAPVSATPAPTKP